MLKFGDENVTVSFSDADITLTATYLITVVRKSIVSIEIATPPQKLEYTEGDIFEPEGMTIKACYNNGIEEIVEGWAYDKTPLKSGDEYITIEYLGLTVKQAITVVGKKLAAIAVSAPPHKLKYVEGEFFDFIGVEIRAEYENAVSEIISAWDYDKRKALTADDREIIFSYSLHGVTKTIGIAIEVVPAAIKTPDEQLAESLLAALPPADELTAENLDAIDYVLSVLDGAANLPPEFLEKKAELEAKRQEIAASLPPQPEAVYRINYAIADGLNFADINYGGNPDEYRDSDGKVMLNPAYSDNADGQGYVFVSWIIGGQAVRSLADINGDTTVYALFKMSETVDVVFKNAVNGAELYAVDNVPRTEAYDFEFERVGGAILEKCGLMAVAYYSDSNELITTADLSTGKTASIKVIVSKTRIINLPDGGGATLRWRFAYNEGGFSGETAQAPNTGSEFAAPLGSEITITALNANIKDIIVDGTSMGVKVNNTVVQAEFKLEEGEYGVSVTFEKVVDDMITLSFIGNNQHSIVYPQGFDGYIAAIDLERVEFIFDEKNENYLNIYSIGGEQIYFEDLATRRFDGDTEIRVKKIRNSFAFTIVYDGGIEKIDGLRGKRTLGAALRDYDADALNVINAILMSGRLFKDAELSAAIDGDELMKSILRNDLTIYSDWAPSIPEPPDYGSVDYSGESFVGNWTSTFMADGDILASELELTADGLYVYKSYINGKLSADIQGIYRVEDGKINIKTFNPNYEYDIISIKDLEIDAEFAADGLLRVNYIELKGSEKTVFEHTMVSYAVRPVNYTGKNFIGVREFNGVKLDLRANGTATAEYGGESAVIYYRISKNGALVIFDNGAFGTGEISGLTGGQA